MGRVRSLFRGRTPTRRLMATVAAGILVGAAATVAAPAPAQAEFPGGQFQIVLVIGGVEIDQCVSVNDAGPYLDVRNCDLHVPPFFVAGDDQLFEVLSGNAVRSVLTGDCVDVSTSGSRRLFVDFDCASAPGFEHNTVFLTIESTDFVTECWTAEDGDGPVSLQNCNETGLNQKFVPNPPAL